MQDIEDGKHSRAAFGYVDDNRYRRISKCIRCNPSGDSFQNATRWMLLVSQFVGIMPLIGVLGVSRKSQQQSPSFRWRSPNTLYAILLITVSAVETSLCVFQIFKTGFFFGNFGALTFYLLAFVSRTLCFNLALHWPKVLRYWRATEHIFLELPYTSPAAAKSRSFSLAIRTNVTFGFFIFLSLGEWVQSSLSPYLSLKHFFLPTPSFLPSYPSGAFSIQLDQHEGRKSGPAEVQLEPQHCGAVPAESAQPFVPLCRLPALDGSLSALVQYLLHVHRLILGHSNYSHRMGVHYALQSNHRSITALRTTRT